MKNKIRQPKEIILAALHNYRGDDLIRAEIAFKHLTEIELDMQYGQSGKTHRQILKEYRDSDTEIKNAILWANTL